MSTKILLALVWLTMFSMTYCSDCSNCGIKTDTFCLINSGYTHGAPVEAVAFLCNTGHGRAPLVAVGGHTSVCLGVDYPVSLRICTMNPETGVLDMANSISLHPTEHIYGLSWCYVPASGQLPEQILLAVVGSQNSNNENVWIYECAGGIPDNATLIASFNHGTGDLLSASFLCQNCPVSDSSARARLLAVGGELGEGPDGLSHGNVRLLRLTLEPTYSLVQTDYNILGNKVYQVAFSPCTINGCYYLAAGAQPEATTCPDNFQLYTISCVGSLTQILDYFLIGNQTTKVRSVAWCCIDARRELIAVTIDPALETDFLSFPAGSNVLIFFYNPTTASLMPIAYKVIPAMVLASAWNPCPECACKQITIGAGCSEYCIENIYELRIDCSKAPHYPNELLEVSKRNFDDHVTSLDWCCKPGSTNCSYLLTGSESKSYDPYAQFIDPFCNSEDDPCVHRDFAVFKGIFCQRPVPLPLPVCERSSRQGLPIKRLK